MNLGNGGATHIDPLLDATTTKDVATTVKRHGLEGRSASSGKAAAKGCIGSGTCLDEDASAHAAFELLEESERGSTGGNRLVVAVVVVNCASAANSGVPSRPASVRQPLSHP